MTEKCLTERLVIDKEEFEKSLSACHEAIGILERPDAAALRGMIFSDDHFGTLQNFATHVSGKGKESQRGVLEFSQRKVPGSIAEEIRRSVEKVDLLNANIFVESFPGREDLKELEKLYSHPIRSLSQLVGFVYSNLEKEIEIDEAEGQEIIEAMVERVVSHLLEDSSARDSLRVEYVSLENGLELLGKYFGFLWKDEFNYFRN